ncbi:MFS transporter [Skermania piniformis]|uniref:MFS transporter n=1 Tax=Skermania pinensis TaxID=39122 RepID=A0ABX8S9K8_9ACTN|nr:MFS transporter [Skermania piniformis]QXQ13857.1 MFS transporter [Skermania piniformis]
MVESSGSPGTFAALRVRNYRLYATGMAISNNGTWMQRIALDWLVYSLTGSSFAVGVTTALQFGPMLFLGLFGGLIADRYPQRRLLLFTQSAFGLLATVLAVLAFTHTATVGVIYLVAFGLGLVTVVDNPARQTFVGVMVPARLMRNAVSLNSGNFQLARLTGPALAGVVVATAGPAWAFAVNAVTFAATLTALTLMRSAEFEQLPREPRGRGQLRAGLRYVAARPALLWPIVLLFFIGGFGFNFAIVLTAYAGEVFDGGPGLYGWLNSTLAAGSVVGALLAARRPTVSARFLFGSAAAFGGTLVLAGLAPTLWLLIPALAACGLAGVGFNTSANSSVQLATDPTLRGRVMSLYFLVLMGSIPIGSLIVGGITERWGPSVALVISGAICVVAAGSCARLAGRETHASDA